MNTLGTLLRLTTAGESHGPAMVGILDGFPAGVMVDVASIDRFLALRAPGHLPGITSPRRDSEHVEILSGMIDGVTTGTPIAFAIHNRDGRPEHYEHLRHAYRPSHADYTYQMKYGIRDHRGGGRASARETALRVVGGAFALAALHRIGIDVWTFTSQIGNIRYTPSMADIPRDVDVYEYSMRCPDTDINARMEALARRVGDAGDTIGGIVTCVVRGLPAGIGEPVYGKLQARLAAAIMSINAVKGFEYGMGFEGATQLGSEMNDEFILDSNGDITTRTNHSGGIQGGISNGRPVYFRVAFKPIATLMRDTPTVTDTGERVILPPRGRHDACAVPRAVPVVQCTTALAILDAVLLSHAYKL